MAEDWLFAHTYPVTINQSELTINSSGSGTGGGLRVSENPIEVDSIFTVNGQSSVAWTVATFSNGGIVGSSELAPDVYFLFTNDTGLQQGNVEPTNSGPLPVCFLAGTAIATPGGSVPVERLAIGDVVLTATGEHRPVLWVGRQTCHSRFGDPLRVLPIRIAPGALGDGLPNRDLCLSPDHALLIDGVLVQAGALVNGWTITRMAAAEVGDRFVYFHIELEDHALLLAEGVPAETFVDNVTRRRFDNFHEYEERFGTATAPIAEMALPRVKSARQLGRTMRADLAEPAHR
jgi:hypothetical protein